MLWVHPRGLTIIDLEMEVFRDTVVRRRHVISSASSVVPSLLTFVLEKHDIKFLTCLAEPGRGLSQLPAPVGIVQPSQSPRSYHRSGAMSHVVCNGCTILPTAGSYVKDTLRVDERSQVEMTTTEKEGDMMLEVDSIKLLLERVCQHDWGNCRQCHKPHRWAMDRSPLCRRDTVGHSQIRSRERWQSMRPSLDR